MEIKKNKSGTVYREKVYINGKGLNSPFFSKKKDAEEWKSSILNYKNSIKNPLNESVEDSKLDIILKSINHLNENIISLSKKIDSLNLSAPLDSKCIDQDELLIDIKDLSDYLKTSVGHIRKLVFEKKIPYRKIGKSIRFKKSEIDLWTENPCEYKQHLKLRPLV